MQRSWLSIALGLAAMLSACGGSSSNPAASTAPTINSIHVSPSNPSSPAGETQQFSASAEYSDGSSKDVTDTAAWSSSNAGVATIGSKGLATAKAVGTSNIKAAVGAVSGSTALTVTAPALKSITISPAMASVPAGTMQQFTATGTYSDGSTQNLTANAVWSSSNSGVATIASGGLAAAKAAGTSTISATIGAVSGSAALTVTAVVPVLTSIMISPATASVPVGTMQQFTATGNYSDGSTQNLTASAVWSSSNLGVATIASGGLATAKAVGTSTIQAAVGTVGGSAALTVTAVVPVLTSITVAPATASVPVGTTQQFTATGNYSDGSTQNLTMSATWSSSNLGVATIAPGGLATAKTVGTSTITAKSGTISGTALLTVSNATLVSISVTPANPSIPLGLLQDFAATGTYSDGSTLDITNKVTWSSSRSAVASITAAGVATARNLGNTTIQATLGAIHGTTNLNVNAASLSSITIPGGDITIAEKTRHAFKAIGLFNDGGTRDLSENVTWTSSNPTTASIAANSPIAKGLAVGSTTITAALGSASASVGLTVTDAEIQSISVTPVGQTIAPTTEIAYLATGTFSDSTTQPLNLDIVWSSSNPGVATIGGAGIAQAIASGSTQIGASFDGKSGSTTLNVSSATLTSIAISPATALIAPASTQTFSVVGTFSDGSTQSVSNIASWSSSDTTVATISNTGVATGQSAGATTITATVGSVSNTAALTVAASTLTAISITPAVGSVPQGIGISLVATGTFADGTQQDLTDIVTWTSSPAAFATVSNIPGSQGLATGVAPGQATITAIFAGIVGVAALNVDNATLNSIEVTPAGDNVALGARPQFSATGHFSDGTTQDLTDQVTWSSSDATVAVISPKGLVSTSGVGTATIEATLAGVNGNTTLTVH